MAPRPSGSTQGQCHNIAISKHNNHGGNEHRRYGTRQPPGDFGGVSRSPRRCRRRRPAAAASQTPSSIFNDASAYFGDVPGSIKSKVCWLTFDTSPAWRPLRGGVARRGGASPQRAARVEPVEPRTDLRFKLVLLPGRLETCSSTRLGKVGSLAASLPVHFLLTSWKSPAHKSCQ